MTVLTFGETMALASAVGTGPLAHTATMELGIGGSESTSLLPSHAWEWT